MERVVVVLVEVQREIRSPAQLVLELPGAGWVTQATRAWGTHHCDSAASPTLPKVSRVPPPTRLDSIPSSWLSRQPRVSRKVEPSALPLKQYQTLLRNDWRLAVPPLRGAALGDPRT